MARGLSAVCLLVILVVVAYDVLVIQPFSNQVRIPSVRYFGQGDPLPLSNKPCVVLIVGALIQTPGNLHHLICWPGTISIYGYMCFYKHLHNLDRLHKADAWVDMSLLVRPFFFFSAGGKLANQHGITPIVWAWLSRPTENLPGFQTPPELLTWVRSKGNVALLYSEQACHTGRTSVLLYLLWSLVIGPGLFLVFVFRSFVLHAVSFSSLVGLLS